MKDEKIKNKNLKTYYAMLRQYNYEKNDLHDTLVFLECMMDYIGKIYYDDENFIFEVKGVPYKKWMILYLVIL